MRSSLKEIPLYLMLLGAAFGIYQVQSYGERHGMIHDSIEIHGQAQVNLAPRILEGEVECVDQRDRALAFVREARATMSEREVREMLARIENELAR